MTCFVICEVVTPTIQDKSRKITVHWQIHWMFTSHWMYVNNKLKYYVEQYNDTETFSLLFYFFNEIETRHLKP